MSPRIVNWQRISLGATDHSQKAETDEAHSSQLLHNRVVDVTEPSNDFRRRFPSAPSSARGARDFVSGVLRGAQLESTVIGEFELIVSELVANAVEHGDGGDVEVHMGMTDAAWLILTIRSGISRRMPPLDPALWMVAAASQPSGRGLGIVKELSHEVDVVRDGNCLEITCRRRR